MADRPLVVLIEPRPARRHHADTLSSAGFHVVRITAQNASVDRVLAQRPNLVAEELVTTHLGRTWTFVRLFRERWATRFIPLIVYGHHLRLADIDAAALAGALWLQVAPSDGTRLVAAARGLLLATRATPA